MQPLFLADLILILHVLVVVMVILPVPLIILGGIVGWKWVRVRWWRLCHLGLIGYVALQPLLGQLCPLTIWENALREAGGDEGYGTSFISYWLRQFLYHDLPSWVFTVAYVSFALLVLILYVLVRPVRQSSSY